MAWVDYFGIPAAVSAPFTIPENEFGIWEVDWQIPPASSLPPGQHTLHVLLQGNGALYAPLYFVFSTVSATATIDPRLNTDCSPVGGSTSAAMITQSRRGAG